MLSVNDTATVHSTVCLSACPPGTPHALRRHNHSNHKPVRQSQYGRRVAYASPSLQLHPSISISISTSISTAISISISTPLFAFALTRWKCFVQLRLIKSQRVSVWRDRETKTKLTHTRTHTSNTDADCDCDSLNSTPTAPRNLAIRINSHESDDNSNKIRCANNAPTQHSGTGRQERVRERVREKRVTPEGVNTELQQKTTGYPYEMLIGCEIFFKLTLTHTKH